MFHSTSGKSGIGYSCFDKSSLIPRSDLIEILKREDELRFSAKVQEEYSREFSSANDYLHHVKNITVDLQKQALRDCGYPESALSVFQSHRSTLDFDDELLQVCLFLTLCMYIFINSYF